MYAWRTRNKDPETRPLLSRGAQSALASDHLHRIAVDPGLQEARPTLQIHDYMGRFWDMFWPPKL